MKIHKIFVFVSLISSLLISLAIPVKVIADENPPPSTEEPVAPPTDIPTPEETEPALVDPTEDTTIPPTEEPNLTDTNILPVEVFPSTEEPLLGALPQDTEIIVQVDGEIEPLATQAAQNAIIVGDPIWCPDGVAAPTPNMFGCTDSYITLEDLIDDILLGNISAPNEDGIIWITNSVPDASGNPIVIDGNDPSLGTWSDYSLTIQGGWLGPGNGTSVSGNSIFSVPISIVNWNATVTVNNITFDNVGDTALFVETIDADIEISQIVSTDNAGLGNNGIELRVNDTLSLTGGSVTVSDVTSTGNGGSGLSITGLVIDVDLVNVNASNNGDNGIFIEALGDVNAENITASGNDVGGMDVTSSGGSVSVLGTNLFENNNETGLYIDANGDVELENITANGNGAGAILGNGAEVYSVTGAVNMSGANVFNNNLNNGLLVESGADASVENVTASQNGDTGAEFNVTGSLSILGTNLFENNSSLGLYIEADGDIDTENITATANGVELYAGGSIFMNGTNAFTGNTSGAGLYAEAGGEIDTENITASNNSGVGAEFIAQADVTLSGNNVFQQNTGSGLYAQSVLTGDVNVENLTANENGGIGAELYANAGNIFLTGNNIFNDNQSAGLYADAGGDISAQNIDAGGNSVTGAELIASGDVTLTGTNVFQANSQIGLYVEADGSIQVSNVTSRFNLIGVLLDAGNDINLTGTNQFSNNTNDGMQIFAFDDIYIENATVQNNGALGMYLDAKGDAQVICSVVSGNTGYEIEADVTGTITLAGTDFGNDIDNNLNLDEDRLLLVSNSCFVYPPFLFENDNDDDDGGDDTPEPVLPPLPITGKTGVDRQVIGLDCKAYSGTKLFLLSGDNVYIPCPIIDSARLIGIPEEGLTARLPDGYQFVSGFILDIYVNGQLIGYGGESGLIDFSNLDPASNSTYSYVYWDGSKWVEVNDRSFPYMGLFFVATEDMMSKNMAILFWDGSEWVELKDDAQFGQGRKVDRGGYFVKIDGRLYYSATVNFTGLFVMVEK